MPEMTTAPGLAEHIEQFAESYLGKATVEHDTEYGEKIPADRIRAALENARLIGEALGGPVECWSHVPYMNEKGEEFWAELDGADRDLLQRALVYAAGELAALQREFNETAQRAVGLMRLLGAEEGTRIGFAHPVDEPCPADCPTRLAEIAACVTAHLAGSASTTVTEADVREALAAPTEARNDVQELIVATAADWA